MSNDERPDERQEEREFLEGLKARTGRDLAEWMAAIAARGFSDKNEIIDWLRAEGLPFARASWLERIHRNGGKPIHATAPPATAAGAPPRHEEWPAKAETPAPQPKAAPEVKDVKNAKAVKTAKAPEAPIKGKPVPPPADAVAELEKLVSAAKGYRPLYHMLEAQIRQAIPDVVIAPQSRYVSLGAPNEFAAVTLHPTEIRLGLALGDRLFDTLVQKAKLRGPGAAITHMVLLTDARQVNDELLALVRAANHRVNGAGQ
jgi:Domain of unknown function (DUF5655)/Domain of unknown function (DUF4287)